MLLKLRQRMAKDESGFTLVELLVVMLILGLLAAIAIPAFFNQRDKARDAQAKTYARTAETAAETIATDNQGVYSGAGGVTVANLTVNVEETLTGATLSVSNVTDDTYTVTATSDTGTHVQYQPPRERHHHPHLRNRWGCGCRPNGGTGTSA